MQIEFIKDITEGAIRIAVENLQLILSSNPISLSLSLLI